MVWLVTVSDIPNNNNYQNVRCRGKVALNSFVTIFLKLCKKLFLEIGVTEGFLRIRTRIKGLLKDFTVALVSYYVMKMTTSLLNKEAFMSF